jgi:hypothetical protein
MNNYNYVNNNNTNSQLMASPMRIRAMTWWSHNPFPTTNHSHAQY